MASFARSRESLLLGQSSLAEAELEMLVGELLLRRSLAELALVVVEYLLLRSATRKRLVLKVHVLQLLGRHAESARVKKLLPPRTPEQEKEFRQFLMRGLVPR